MRVIQGICWILWSRTILLSSSSGSTLMSPEQPRLYSELASWFHLLTAPESYVEEAEFARQTLIEASSTPIRAVLELGAGGGNNAFHLKKFFKLTLTDLSADMLERSRSINPECEHIVGDMRS